MITWTVLLRSIGTALAVGSQAWAVVELRRAYRQRAVAAGADPPFLWFMLRRRVPKAEFTESGWRHWQRAGWIAPAGWLIGGALVLATL
jgi:hypothetical protein